MKFEEYERPDLEELELLLEGPFLTADTDEDNPGFDKDDNPDNGDF